MEVTRGVSDKVAMRDVGLLTAAASRRELSVIGDDAYPAVSGRGRRVLPAAQDLTQRVDKAEDLKLSAAFGRSAGGLNRRLTESGEARLATRLVT